MDIKDKPQNRMVVRLDDEQRRLIQWIVKMGFSSEAEVLSGAIRAFVKAMDEQPTSIVPPAA